MATIVEKKFVDDLDGSNAAETVSFSFDNMGEMEIDLSEENALRFRLLMAEFVAAARPRMKPKASGKKRKASTSGYDVPKVRAWWAEVWLEEGLPMAQDRARIPNSVVARAVERGIIPDPAPALALVA
jgi:hypothetical protein